MPEARAATVGADLLAAAAVAVIAARVVVVVLYRLPVHRAVGHDGRCAADGVARIFIFGTGALARAAAEMAAAGLAARRAGDEVAVTRCHDAAASLTDGAAPGAAAAGARLRPSAVGAETITRAHHHACGIFPDDDEAAVAKFLAPRNDIATVRRLPLWRRLCRRPRAGAAEGQRLAAGQLAATGVDQRDEYLVVVLPGLEVKVVNIGRVPEVAVGGIFITRREGVRKVGGALRGAFVAPYVVISSCRVLHPDAHGSGAAFHLLHLEAAVHLHGLTAVDLDAVLQPHSLDGGRGGRGTEGAGRHYEHCQQAFEAPRHFL